MTEPVSHLYEVHRMETPASQWKQPEFELGKTGCPVWTLEDEDGRRHRLYDGCRVTKATFRGFNLAGVRLQSVSLSGVQLIGCRIANLEIQDSHLTGIVLRSGQGGPVLKNCRITDMVVDGLGDHDAVLRFFGSELSRVVLTNLICGLDFARSHGSSITLQRSTINGLFAVRSCDLSDVKIFETIVHDALMFSSTLTGSEIVRTQWKHGRLDSVDMSCSTIRETSFESLNIDKLSLDVASLDAVSFKGARARQVSATHAELADVEIINGVFVGEFHDCSIRSMMFWKAYLSIIMVNSVGVGMRVCDSLGCVSGRRSTWWRPVIRRSALCGNGDNLIAMRGADITNTKVISEFATWLDIEEGE